MLGCYAWRWMSCGPLLPPANPTQGKLVNGRFIQPSESQNAAAKSDNHAISEWVTLVYQIATH